jgi:hypothetical protein
MNRRRSPAAVLFEHLSNGKVTMTFSVNLLRKSADVFAFSLLFILSLAFVPRCYAQVDAQAQNQAQAHVEVAGLHKSEGPSPKKSDDGTGADRSESRSRSTPAADPEMPAAVARELEALKVRIAQLEAELKRRAAPEQPAAVAPATPSIAPGVTPANSDSVSSNRVVASVEPQATEKGKPVVAPPTEPFAYADWTWLNGTPRNKDVVWDSKFFTPAPIRR